MVLSSILKKYSKKSSVEVYVTTIDTTLGKLVAAADEDFIYMVSFEDSKNMEKYIQTISEQLSCTFVEDTNKLLQNFESELKDYLEGNLKKFTVPIKMFGSDFQKEVWNGLLNMPYASTQTYGDMAKVLGRPTSHSRAVGAACGANAHVIVIPCHRLVASGSKGGFSCGIDRKDWLLKHEKDHSS
ncbi:methylated-DNA--protein-cysteine methyltransferase [Epargyreus clarus]|uniref:methylated-DNA--protein-cysteine methyltransferase n=1 Tax=Epargyreus clarus TaxID=520877 RepID=UPI003C2DB819